MRYHYYSWEAKMHVTQKRCAALMLFVGLGLMATVQADTKIDMKGVNTKADEQQYLKLFKGKFIIPNDVISPEELPESVLIIDDYGTPKANASWLKVRADRPELKPIFVNEMIFQSILDGSAAANANYLIFSSGLEGNAKVEILVENVFRVNGAPYTDPVIKTAADTIVEQHRRPNRRFFYVQHLLYTTVKHRKFGELKGSAKLAGLGFGADGKVFASKADFSLEKVVSVNAFELIPKLVDMPVGVMGPKGTPDENIPPSYIPDLGARVEVNVVKNSSLRNPLRIPKGKLKQLPD